MQKQENFEFILSGGHPNSLGRTLGVVDLILKDQEKLEDLYQCYFSADQVVRLRVSNAFKRITRARKDWFLPYVDKFLENISSINQASIQWTFAQLFLEVGSEITNKQKLLATEVMKSNLVNSNDWIVFSQTLQTLGEWAKTDEDLRDWLKPQLQKLMKNKYKSVAGKAEKINKNLLSINKSKCKV